ncbi:MAG: mechanosensitive ion channel [Planctomycetales bacterium]|nr:mechanosensitive ion channel [Planctomycetales bacterium]
MMVYLRNNTANLRLLAQRRLSLVVGAFALGGVLLGVARTSSGQQTIIDALSSSARKAVAPEPSSQPKAASTPQGIADQRKAVAQRLLVAQKQNEAEVDGTPAEANGKPSREVDLLKQLDLLLSQHQSAEDRRKQLEATKEDLQSRIDTLQREGPPGEPPFSFLQLDELESSLKLEQERALTIEAAVESAKDSLRIAKDASDRAEAQRRQAKEALEGEKDETKRARLAETFHIAELESQISKQQVSLAKVELDNAEQEAEAAQLRRDLIERQIAGVRDLTRFSGDDLDKKLLEIEKRESDLASKLQSAELMLPFLERQWAQARSDLEAAETNDPVLTAEADARQLDHQTLQQRISLYKQQLERLAMQREVWNRRFRVYQHFEKRGELRQWADETRLKIAELERKRQLEELQMTETRNALGELDKRLQGGADRSAEETHWINEQQEARRKQIIDRGQNLVSIDATLRLFQKLNDDIRIDTESFSLAATAEAIWANIAAIWNYEITTSDDESITVGKVVGVLLLLAFGFWCSRVLSRLFGKRLLPRLGVNESAASALQTIAFYLLVTISALTALRLVNVPLTVFTVLGGAVAIGVGFGSQNVMNNFISGLILLAERPIRVGDMIELSGLFGTIEKIGARSTWVKTGENYEIIVPNSSFLENQVVNWTLTDSIVRCRVRIGVAYGSPTRDVARWLRKAADDHGLVLDRPEPFVWFTEFGDNALIFDLHFWVTVRNLTERRRVESDMRFMIDQSFREAGIVIAFPQRDLHLDTLKPLEIRMLPPNEPAPDSAQVEKPAA